jgi:hypothetical protein
VANGHNREEVQGHPKNPAETQASVGSLLGGAAAASFSSMRGRAVRTLLTGAAVFLVSALASAQCTKDTDCKGDRVCEAGKCTSPVALPPAPPAPPGSEAPAGVAPVAPAAATPDAGEEAPSAGEPPPAKLVASPLAVEAEPVSEAPPGALAPLGQDEPQTRRRNRNAMVAGIVMVSVGPIALLGALAAKNAQEKCDASLQQQYPDHQLPTSEKYRVEQCNGYSAPLYVFGIGGALLTVAGIPLIIYGGKQVPAGPAAARLRVLPWAGPESSGLKLRLEM